MRCRVQHHVTRTSRSCSYNTASNSRLNTPHRSTRPATQLRSTALDTEIRTQIVFKPAQKSRRRCSAQRQIRHYPGENNQPDCAAAADNTGRPTTSPSLHHPASAGHETTAPPASSGSFNQRRRRSSDRRLTALGSIRWQFGSHTIDPGMGSCAMFT